MRLSKSLLCLGLSAALVLTLATNVNAARRSSLHGNLLLEDVTDVYAMPQLLLKYRNLMRVHVGSDFNTGDGLLIFGTDTMAFGVVAHRSDNRSPFGSLLTPAVGSASLLQGAQGYELLDAFPTPHTIVDLLMSLKMGETASLGFRLGLANGGSSVSPDGGDSTGTSQTSLLLGAGYSLMGDSLRADLGLALSIGLGSTDQGGGTEQSGNDINIALGGRFYLPMAEQVELGILGNLGVGFGGTTTTSGGAESSTSAFDLNVSAAAGPVYTLGKARIAAYGFIGLNTSSEDPNTDADDDDTSSLTLVIPGVHMAMEVDITEWFRFRAGLEYRWMIESDSNASVSEGENGGSFGWSTGFGLVFDKFNLDFALENAFLTTGPNFLSGGANGFASSVAASYSF